VKRRAFITLLGGAATWPLAARAQQPAKLPTIGYLGSITLASQRPWVAAFGQRLGELGWIEGRTVVIEYRWAEGLPERLAEIAAEFVRLKVDVILAAGTEAALAAKQATAVIPIVFPIAGDPVGTGLVASLARPGGNITGLSNQIVDLAAKRLEIFREVLPSLSRLAILVNAGYPGGGPEIGEIHAAGRTLGFEVVSLEIRRTEDIAPALESLKGGAEALYVVGDPLMNFNRTRINTFALAARLPTIFVNREYLEGGGLMSYGPSYPDMNRCAGDYVDKILRGAKPADLPGEQPTKFDFVVNSSRPGRLASTCRRPCSRAPTR
jgi:putative tryptophan/tyrosine transport system substrate-binding protein